MTSSKRIGIIGSGISGLTVAHLLSKKYEVKVFEANDYIGGHTHTVPVVMNNSELNVDTGFIVCNDRNYPKFLKLLGQLGVEYQRTEMSFSVVNKSLDLEYNGHNLDTLFAQRRNILRPKFIGMVRDIIEFNKRAKEALSDPSAARMTLDDFIHCLGLGDWFRNNYVLPMVAAIWSCSTQQAGEFPLQFFLKFFNHHGLLDIQNRPQWYVLKNGSHSYIEPLTKPFRDNIYLSTPVLSVARDPEGATITTAKGTDHFDEVIFACHSNQALTLLADPTAAETQVLGNLAYQDNDVVLHTDARLMPKRQRAWAAWNFHLDHNGSAGDTGDASPVVTYNMNILQGLVSSDPLLVTLNANHLIEPSKVIRKFNYSHPVYSLESFSSARAKIAYLWTQQHPFLRCLLVQRIP